ncbi:hypothetical protein [Olsenella sp. HMSC062G07]|uniref:hypothetical protein n=1 Tax=Olsenella sp. HMSC062G07 TaxID=1739330 RepID=UPI0011D0799E|nr:hypothetical protein [Olsenella sp. HMSC062G07]
MDEALRRKLAAYFTAPADIPASKKFADWIESDFEKASKIRELNAPENYAEYEAFKQKVLKGAF